jgi:pilus assembly protein CpaE
MTASISGRSLVVAAEPYIDELHLAKGLRGLEGAALLPLPADAPLPDELLARVRVIVLEVDATSEPSLARLSQVRVAHPGVTIIAAVRHADLSLTRALIRQGIVDVAQLPFNAHDLSEQVLDALSREAERLPSANLGKLVTVLRASGGCGATSLLTHLGEAIPRLSAGSKRVCLVDLDIQGGDIASYLGVEPQVTVDALLEAGSRLDQELVRSAITETSHGFDIIAAPEHIAKIDTMNVDHLLATLKMVRSLYDIVLVDLPAAWTDWSLSVVNSADRILLLTDTSISSLRQAKRRLRLLRSIDIAKSRIEVVVNRLERRLFRGVGTADVADALDCQVISSLTLEPSALRAAQDQGLLITESQGRTRFATDVDGIAELLIDSAKGG